MTVAVIFEHVLISIHFLSMMQYAYCGMPIVLVLILMLHVPITGLRPGWVVWGSDSDWIYM